MKELENFRFRISHAGHEQFVADWRMNEYDDRVLTVTLAVWVAELYPPFTRNSIRTGGARLWFPRGAHPGVRSPARPAGRVVIVH